MSRREDIELLEKKKREAYEDDAPDELGDEELIESTSEEVVPDEEAGTEENEMEDSIELYRQRALEAERKYRALSDMRELSAEFDALSDMVSTDALPKREEYERLRNMGFSAREAFLATNSDLILKAPSKGHLKSVVTHRAADAGAMSDEEYAVIKAVFGDSLSDERIAELYKRVKR